MQRCAPLRSDRLCLPSVALNPVRKLAGSTQKSEKMVSESPAISVLLPVRNGSRYLAPAIDSVLAQTFTDFELLLIDDGSTDQSPRVLADYAKRDSRIRLLKGPADGLSKALNLALGVARAPLLARMDC